MQAIRAILVVMVWLVSIGGAGLGVFILVTGFIDAKSAPQEAVIAALACACAILPYCFARAVTEMLRAISEAAAATRHKSVGREDLRENKTSPVPSDYNYKRL